MTQAPSNDHPSSLRRGTLCAVLVLAAALRVAALDKPLYIDEIVSLTVATQPLERMGAVMRQIDASPALAPLLLHGWTALSDSDAWARLLMAIFGWLTVPAVYALASRAFGAPAGLWAAFAAAIAPALVHYSQYVRSYSLFTLLAVVHLWLAVTWFSARQDAGAGGTTSGRGRVRWLAIVLVAAAMIYAHYLALVYFIAPALVAVALIRRQRTRVTGWIAAHAVALVLFAPGVPLLLHNVAADTVRNEQRPRPGPAWIVAPNVGLELVVGQRALGFDAPRVRRSALIAAAVVFPALAVAGVISGWRRNPTAVMLLVACATVPLALYVGSGRRLVAVRFFLPSLAAVLVIVGEGLRRLPLRARIGAAVALSVLSAVPLHHFLTRYQWSYDHERVAAALREQYRPGDVLLVVHPYEAFYYRRYLGDAVSIHGVTFTPLVDQPGYVIKPVPLDADAVRPRVRAVASGAGRVWLIGQSNRSFASSPAEQRELVAWLETSYGEVARLDALTGGDPIVRAYRGGRTPKAPPPAADAAR